MSNVAVHEGAEVKGAVHTPSSAQRLYGRIPGLAKGRPYIRFIAQPAHTNILCFQARGPAES